MPGWPTILPERVLQQQDVGRIGDDYRRMIQRFGSLGETNGLLGGDLVAESRVLLLARPTPV